MEAQMIKARCFAAILVALLLSCRGAPLIEPPTFDYRVVTDRFFTENPGGHFPLTVQRGANLHPSATLKGQMFYTSDVSGSGDIWMRDLRNTINLPIIQHPAQQYHPAASPNGTHLVFISDDLDSAGDLRLVHINPDNVVKLALQGVTKQNYWDMSVSLSKLIEAAAMKLPEACHGPAAEDDPVFLADNKTLLFASDRCTPGQMNLWSLQVGDEEIAGLTRLTQNGGRQPSPSVDGRTILFVAYRDPALQGELYLRAPDGSERRLPIAKQNGTRTFAPTLSLDGRTAYYIAVREDTNRDGQLDLSDQAGVYALPVDATSPAAEAVLLDDTSVQGIGLCAWGGFLFYAANISGSINIYYLKPDGIIPRRPTIESQFALALRYSKASVRRNFLALDAVKQYFLSAPETALYEGLIVIEKWKRMTRSRVAEDLAKELRDQVSAATGGNRFAGLQFDLEKARSEGRPTSPTIGNFLKQLGGPKTDRDKLFQAGALEEFAAALYKEMRYTEALAAVSALTERYPSYHRAARARLLQASILLQTAESPGAISDDMLSKPETPQIVKDELLTRIYDFYYSGRSGGRALTLIERELARTGIHREVAGTLRVVRARIYYDRRNFSGALGEANAATAGIPRESSVFVRGRQLAAFIHERLGNSAEAFFARMDYGGAFRPDSGVSVTAKEYRELMDEGGRSAERALESARSIAKAIDEAEDNVFGPLAVPLVKVSGLDRDVLAEFCAPGSAPSRMFPGLGPPNAQNYMEFCVRNSALVKDRIKDPFPADQAAAAVDLLYVYAYSNVNALNILFFYMKKVNLFTELHAEKSVHFHRLKVDTAIERNRRRLRKSRQNLTIPGAGNVAELFVADDPFDARTFQELEHGYKISSEPARQAGDLSLLYGYAYTLIQKSVEREQFYDEIRRAGSLIPEEAFREKKESVLKDMKTAEYQLRYVLLIDPVNADAYLLMGWLYQYLDERKSQTVRREPGYVEKLYNWVTKTRPAAPTEGRQYYSLYANYFPEQLFESNVELYRQALNMRVSLAVNPMETAHLNLNLGNNYFHLLNFKRAAAAYGEVDRAATGRGQPLFASYRQEGLFRFNFARSLYYEGRNTEAAVQFEKAHQVYYTNEKKPLDEEAAALRYRRDQVREGEKQAVEKRIDENASMLKESRFRLALISALRGLVSLDEGRYEEGIASLEDARRQVSSPGPDEAAPPASETLDPAGILNFLAMAHQGQRELTLSDERAEQAGKAAQEVGLSRDDRRYQPQTVGGRMLGCLLNYGEDFAVVGDGRNPYGFSSARQYELSLGIRFENTLLRGDYTKAVALLDERRKVFLDQDGDLSFGKQGAVAATGQKANVLIQSKRYVEAAAHYLEAARIARDYDLLDAFRLHFRNHFHAHFAAQEVKDTSGEIDFKGVDGGLEDMDQFRAQYREKTVLRFVKERTTENPAFKYDEKRDAAAVDRIVDYDLTELVQIRGSLTLYKARRSLTAAKSFAGYAVAQDLYTKAIADFDQATATYRSRGDIVRMTRARINRGRAYLESERLLHARAELDSITESAFEYGLVVEELEAQDTLLAVIRRQYRDGGGKGEPPEGAVPAARILEILDKNPDLTGTLRNHSRFRETAASYLLGAGREQEALTALEQSWSERVLAEYVRFPLPLTDAQAASAQARLRDLLARAVFLREEESRLRITHTNLDKVTAARERTSVELAKAAAALAARLPSHQGFVSSLLGRPAIFPDLRRGGLLFRFYADDESLSVWQFSPGERRFFRKEIAGGLEATFRAAMEENLRGRTGVSSLFIVADRRTFNLPVEKILNEISPQLPAPVFDTRVSARHLDFVQNDADAALATGINVLNADTFASAFPDAYETDAAFVTAPSQPSVFWMPSSPNNLDAREWISELRSPSIVIAKSGTPSYTWNGLLYEIVRAAGAGTMAVDGADDKQRTALLAARGVGRYTGSGLRIFGCPGFVREKVRASVLQTHAGMRSEAERLASIDALGSAVRYHKLAASVMQGLPDAAALGFENRLGLGAALIAKTKGKEGRTALEEMIVQQLTAGNKAGAERVFRKLSEALASIGDIFKAEKTLNEYAKTFPEKKAAIQQEIEMIRFLARLRRPRYGASAGSSTFSQDLERVLPLARQRGTVNLVTDLFRHGLHDEAAGTAAQFRAAGMAVPVSEYDIRADQSLLLGRPVPRASLNEKLTQAGRFLALSATEDWAEYDRSLEAMRPEDNPALFAIKKKLFTLWRSYRLRETAVGFEVQEGPALVGLSLLERSMLFRILTDTVNHDPELLNAQVLESLIRAELNSWSGERAERMALSGAISYLLIGETGTAERFFQLSLESGVGTIAAQSRSVGTARVGLALSAAGRIDALDKEAAWNKTLDDAGSAKSVRLFALVKAKNVDRASLNELTRAAYTQLRDGDTYPDDLQISAAIWKDRALQAEDFKETLNAAFFEEEARNTAVLVRRGRGLPAGWRLPLAADTAGAIFERMPKGQRFTALIDNGSKAFRLIHKDGRIQTDELDETGRRLRAKLLAFMDQARGGLGASGNELGQWLAREYRAVFGGVDSTITYYWFPGVHALFPMVPVRNDRLFQVLDPATFAASTASKTGAEFAQDFKIKASGYRALAAYSARSRDDAEWATRIDTMEVLSLGGRSNNQTDPRHFLDAVLPLSLARLDDWARAIGPKSSSAWFVSGTLLSESVSTEAADYSVLIQYLGMRMSGPGLVTIRIPGDAHPQFVRYYYNRGIPIAAIDRRFAEAYRALAGVASGLSQLYGYRLTTTSFLTDD